ncbi:MAG: hypothetical protein R3A47_10805 [Polyangiales bacterium]
MGSKIDDIDTERFLDVEALQKGVDFGCSVRPATSGMWRTIAVSITTQKKKCASIFVAFIACTAADSTRQRGFCLPLHSSLAALDVEPPKPATRQKRVVVVTPRDAEELDPRHVGDPYGLKVSRFAICVSLLCRSGIRSK